MVLEQGGRADKGGNQYENRYLAKQLLLLIEEKLNSIQVEPLGEEGTCVEFITTTLDGIHRHYQCKASNGGSDHWNASDLERHGVFKKVKSQYMQSSNAEFCFVSPLSYKGLDDLCTRAKANHSAEDFLACQVSNDMLRKAFSDCEQYLQLSSKKEAELRQIVDILSRCNFVQFPFSLDYVDDIELHLSHLFAGNASAARIVLENIINDKNWWGKEISTHDILSFMEKEGFHLRDYGRDETTWSKIQAINQTYWSSCTPINNTVVPRDAVETAMCHLMNQRSVVLHGNAGTGKSFCVELIAKELEASSIPYLRVKLDQYTPQNTSEQFGASLGLPDSPVRCLQRIAADKPCVLILDQLDALRWTTAHSPTALAVCKKLIQEAKLANSLNKAKCAILFVVRSFDYKNDNGIRNLFEEENGGTKQWESVEIKGFSNEEVATLVGDGYATLSKKLKDLLKNPATLFVWFKLDASHCTHSITSAHQLIDMWWHQILDHYATIGKTDKLDQFVQKIVQDMSSASIFALPRKPYAGQNALVQFLISAGILTNNETRISFVHQSFLDYFIVNDSLLKVVAGTSVLNFVGNTDQQTPNLRYRYFVLLQELIDFDESYFLSQSKEILASEHVRFYYKCVVFDVVGQQGEPSQGLLEFAHLYWNDPVWHDYVRQIIYSGSPNYIRSLSELDWFSDEGIWLLRSINETDPGYVVNTLAPLSCQDKDKDGKIISCLCFDAGDDSDEMYQLRMDLLRKNPEFLLNIWTSYYDLFQSGSERALDYISLILDHHDNESLSHVHFPETKAIKAFISLQYQAIVDHIAPKLIKITQGLAQGAHSNYYSKEYTQWIDDPYERGAFRRILCITRDAVKKLAEIHPEYFIKTLLVDGISTSLIGNELLLTALEALPVSYADTVMDWLSAEFPTHLFNYTGCPENNLVTAKRIINKFSSVCTSDSFVRFEKSALKWNDPPARMVSILKHRQEFNREKVWHPVYWPYWGFMQKELLPELDQNRLSAAARELLAVLNRNDWINAPHYTTGPSIGMAKTVVSPVSSYADKLSDKTWLKIIKTPKEKMKPHRSKETETVYIEATHATFSSAMGSAAKIQPVRFARLSLRFPDNCETCYLSAVLSALCQSSSDTQVDTDLELLCAVIRKYAQHPDNYIQARMAEIVQKHAPEGWPEDILNMIEQIALQPVSDADRRYALGSENEPSAHNLYTGIYNSAQGSAIRAITSLLFSHKELLDRFKQTVVTLISSDEPFIWVAMTDCIAAYYNTQRSFCISCFKQLLNTDARVLIANEAREILARDFCNDRPFYRERLGTASKSKAKDLAERAVSFSCALAIYNSDDVLSRNIREASYTGKQAMKICQQAAKCYEHEAHRDASKDIILYMANKYDVEHLSFEADFLQGDIDLSKDKDFWISLINSRSGKHLVYSLSKYLCSTEFSVAGFAEIILGAAKQTANIQKGNHCYVNLNELVRCVVHLYDEGKDDPKTRTISLDAWDELFKNNISDIRMLTTLLDGFS